MSNEQGGESSKLADSSSAFSVPQVKQHHRHTPEQVQRLEDFYEDCPHPDEKQRQQLSQQLGLEMKQVKFWFQNKRTQMKAMNERADINSVRRSNDQLQSENLALLEALKAVLCDKCKYEHLGEQGKTTLIDKLKQENQEMREQHARIESTMAYMSANAKARHSEHGQSSNPLAHNVNSGTGVSTNMMWPLGPVTRETEMTMIETAKKAVEEVLELVRADESSLWIRSPADPHTLVIRRDRYNNRFPKANNCLKSRLTRFESSKDSAVVALSAEALVKLFRLPVDWVDLFPTIVTNTRTWRITEPEKLGGALHVMYEQMHAFSPLLAPREFRLLRYIIQIEPSCWMVANVSFDCSTVLQEPSPPPCCWRLPSGCLIEGLPGGNSKVTWVEHVEVADKTLTDSHLFRDSVCTSRTYGAKLWIATLGRTCERLAYSVGLMKPIHRHALEEVNSAPQGRRGMMKLSSQMVKDFCKMLTTLDKVNRPQPSNLKNSEFWASIHPVEPGKPLEGMVIKAAVTAWLPAACPALFSFYTNEHVRSKWDVSNGYPVSEVAHISCGSHPGNCISILRPFVPNQQQNMLVLQESCIDPSGCYIIYSNVAMPTLTAAISGEDTSSLSLQPSGVTITWSDNIKIHETEGNRISSNSTPRTPHGSFVTVAMQGRIDSENLEASVKTANTLLNSSIENVKVALNLHDMVGML